MDSIRHAPRHLYEYRWDMLDETHLQLMRLLLTMTYGAKTWPLTTQAKNNLAAAQTNINITYRDRKTNICELDDYWKGTIWQRIAQDRQMWKQHQAFAQPRDTMTAQ